MRARSKDNIPKTERRPPLQSPDRFGRKHRDREDAVVIARAYRGFRDQPRAMMRLKKV